MRILIIDNYDSFTYNLYQYVGEILLKEVGYSGYEILVKRNDEITIEQIKHFKIDRVVISPGPGTPGDKEYFGVCSDIILQLGKDIPIMGVCLGMQGIAYCFGGAIIRGSVPMHGKTSVIRHDGLGIYSGVPQNLEIMRYHSLVLDPATLPGCLNITSVVISEDQDESDSFLNAALKGSCIMGVRHKEYPIEGIQHHPESFASEGGKELITNFLLQ